MAASAHSRTRNRVAPHHPIALLPVVGRGLRLPSDGRTEPEQRTDISQHSSIPAGSADTTAVASSFDSFSLHSSLTRALDDAGFSGPRPIQARALPAALQGRDVLGLAQTGTGKTAAFVLPILERLLGKGHQRPESPRALVVTPTRELASQVHAEFERLAVHTKIRSTALFGGVPIARQQRALRQSPEVIVACPGRLLDLLSQRSLRLDRIDVLVLDEADHMFDMGFLPDVRRIVRALPQRRQNLFFSATMPREIRGLADSMLVDPEVVELAHSRPAETIEHGLVNVQEGDKAHVLDRLLGDDSFRSSIVFVRTKRRAKRLAERLAKGGHAAVALQGNMSQPQREKALAAFRQGRQKVMVATDIAARGLDIEGVSHVVNFDVPNTPDAYTHRIGRTGRSEQSGRAFTLATRQDADMIRQIERRLGSRIELWSLAEGSGERVSREPVRSPERRRSAERPRERAEVRGQSPRRRFGELAERRAAERPDRERPVRERPVREPATETRSERPQQPSFGSGVFDKRPSSDPKPCADAGIASEGPQGARGQRRRRRQRRRPAQAARA